MGTSLSAVLLHDRRVSFSRRYGSAMPITNQQVVGHAFLQQMYDDP